MSKPEDIPQDVWDAAKGCVFGMQPNMSDDELAGNVKRVARAIMAAKAEEREACARLADEELLNPFNSPGQDAALREIAKSIRKRGEG